jgi:hypothetical protein
LLDKINPEFLTYQLNKPVGLMLMFSPMYFLGPSKSTTPAAAFSNRDYTKQLSGSLLAVKNKKIVQINF